MELDSPGKWLRQNTHLAFGLPARDVDEAAVNGWVDEILSVFEPGSVNGMDVFVRRLYLDSLDDMEMEPDDAAYNMGIAGAAAYQMLEEPPFPWEWENRFRMGVNHGAIQTDYPDTRNASELVDLGFQEYEELTELGYQF